MRLWNKQPADETRERCLGDIARLFDAAREVESLSPVQQRQIRKRIARTVFRARTQTARSRLAPVFAGLGILVIGGAAFATAERLGLIPRIGHGGASSATPSKSGPRKRKATRATQPSELESPGAAVEEPAFDSATEATGNEPIVLPMVPVPVIAPKTVPRSLPGGHERTPLPAARKDAGPSPTDLTTTRPPLGNSPKPAQTTSHRIALASPALATPAAATTLPVPVTAPAAREPATPQPAVQPVPVPAPTAPVPITAPAVYTPRASASQPAGAPSQEPAKVAPRVDGGATGVPAAAPKAALHAVTDAPAGSRAPASDQALFAQAMRKLRQDNDPAGALSALQEHARAYPRSSFAGERSAIEVEALLALHRDREALARLDGMALDEIPRSGERFVVRGELRAAARRWLEASADFDRALSRISGSPTWHERALWGRGVARLRCGEREAGLADLELYLDRYPKGRFSAEAAKFFPGK